MGYDDIENWIYHEREDWGGYLSNDEFEAYVYDQFPGYGDNEGLHDAILRGLG